jgi:hypothetical protein
VSGIQSRKEKTMADFFSSKRNTKIAAVVLALLSPTCNRSQPEPKFEAQALLTGGSSIAFKYIAGDDSCLGLGITPLGATLANWIPKKGADGRPVCPSGTHFFPKGELRASPSFAVMSGPDGR